MTPYGYAHPEVLVDTGWLGDHLQHPCVRVAEVSEDTRLYDLGHIPGAVHFNWQTQLQDRVRRDWIAKERFEQLLGAYGIDNETVLVLYGDPHNWFAAYSLWLCRMYGVGDVRLLSVLPDRRPVIARVVRTRVPARIPARPQLRRLLDGVGQSGRRAGGAGRVGGEAS